MKNEYAVMLGKLRWKDKSEDEKRLHATMMSKKAAKKRSEEARKNSGRPLVVIE